MLYVSNVAGTSEAIYCNELRTNSIGLIYISSPNNMLPYGLSDEMFIVITSDDDESVNITLHSSIFSDDGMCDDIT